MSKQPTDGLTPRQRDTLAIIVRLKNKNGFPPTQKEIAMELDIKGLAAVRRHVSELCRKGYLARSFNIARGMKVLREAPVFKK